ncbi:MAG: hypothetical protein ACI9V8_001100, partial [Urechidicola sp.]
KYPSTQVPKYPSTQVPKYTEVLQRCFLALIAMDGMYDCFVGVKTGQKKALLFEAPLRALHSLY